MLHLPGLILDLGIILITAGFTTLLFRKFNQPVVLGYIIAGLLVGPQFSFFPTVTDTASVKVWAEIGVIILMFSLGLEFNFKKLAMLGKSVAATALFEITFMLTLGYLVGQLLGWSFMDSLFLGGIISISSTTIIVSSMEELKLKTQAFAHFVFGILVIEDIVAVLILVLLSTVAVTKNLSGFDLLLSSGRLLFFIVLWFLVGIYLLPLFLKKIRNLMTDETTLVVSLALCLLMVVIATQLGFSAALGAFVMGSLLSDTTEGRKVEVLIVPIKNLFAAIFFVSVGMLIDLEVLKDHGLEVLLITAVLIYGKVLSVAVGAFLSGRSHKDSLQAGMSLAQIGEFSFIIAALGLSLNVTSDFLYPIAVSVSAITIFTTPYLMKNAFSMALYLEKKLPTTTLTHMRYYHITLNKQTESPLWMVIYRAFAMKVFFNAVIIVGIWQIFYKYFLPLFVSSYGEPLWLISLTALLGLVISAPFLWAIIMGRPSSSIQAEEFIRVKKLVLGIFVTRATIAIALVVYFLNLYSPLASVFGLLLLFSISILIFSSRRLAETIYHSLESRFLEHLGVTQSSN